MMGDAADDLIEQGMDNLLAHQLGQCDNYCQYCEEEYQKDLRNNRKVKAFEKKFIESQQEFDPECKKILNEHFWELVDDDNTTHNTRKEASRE
jgi:hypothetical protein